MRGSLRGCGAVETSVREAVRTIQGDARAKDCCAVCKTAATAARSASARMRVVSGVADSSPSATQHEGVRTVLRDARAAAPGRSALLRARQQVRRSVLGNRRRPASRAASGPRPTERGGGLAASAERVTALQTEQRGCSRRTDSAPTSAYRAAREHHVSGGARGRAPPLNRRAWVAAKRAASARPAGRAWRARISPSATTATPRRILAAISPAGAPGSGSASAASAAARRSSAASRARTAPSSRRYDASSSANNQPAVLSTGVSSSAGSGGSWRAGRTTGSRRLQLRIGDAGEQRLKRLGGERAVDDRQLAIDGRRQTGRSRAGRTTTAGNPRSAIDGAGDEAGPGLQPLATDRPRWSWSRAPRAAVSGDPGSQSSPSGRRTAHRAGEPQVAVDDADGHRRRGCQRATAGWRSEPGAAEEQAHSRSLRARKAGTRRGYQLDMTEQGDAQPRLQPDGVAHRAATTADGHLVGWSVTSVRPSRQAQCRELGKRGRPAVDEAISASGASSSGGHEVVTRHPGRRPIGPIREEGSHRTSPADSPDQLRLTGAPSLWKVTVASRRRGRPSVPNRRQAVQPNGVGEAGAARRAAPARGSS